jgi:hypothetical protein
VAAKQPTDDARRQTADPSTHPPADGQAPEHPGQAGLSPPAPGAPDGGVYSAAESALVAQRLEALGYIE